MGTWFIGVLFFIIAWWSLFIWLWVKGTREKNAALTIIGGLFTLSIIGLIISVIQVTSWSSNPNYGRVEHHYYGDNKPKQEKFENTEEEKLKQAFLDGILTRQEYEKKMGEL